MSALIKVLKREIGLVYNKKLFWMLAFVIPLSLCLLMCLIFSKGSPTNLPIAVLNEDNSEISRLFVRNINTLPSCSVKYNVLNFQEGHQLLTEGKVYGFIAIPRNFEHDLFRLKQPKLLFYYNNQRILIGGIISKDINTLVQTMMVGIDVKIRTKYGMPIEEAIKQSNIINVKEHILSNPYFNYQYFLSLVAFGHILQINFILTMLWGLGSEFKYGRTKGWLAAANNSIFIAFLGKMIPYFTVYVFLFAVLYFIYFIILGVPYVGNLLMGIISTVVFAFTCCCIAIIFISINGNFRYGLSNAAFYVAMGFAFAGVTYPVMAMPLIAKIYSYSIPITYWVTVMINQSLRGVPFVYDIKNIFAMCILCGISLTFLPRVKKLALDERRWFQL
ncbi:ABC transporter permease [bacterium]|nr:ABC transporter permease [bacterium]